MHYRRPNQKSKSAKRCFRWEYGFIHKQDRGRSDQLTGNRHPSFFPTTNPPFTLIPNPRILNAQDPQLLQRLQHPILFRRNAHIFWQPQQRRIQHRLVYRQGRHQRILLIDEPHYSFKLRIRHIPSIQKEFALNSPLLQLPRHDIEEGGFSGTRGTHDGENLAGAHETRDIIENGLVADAIGDIAELEGCRDMVLDEFCGFVVDEVNVPETLTALGTSRKVPNSQTAEEQKDDTPGDAACDCGGMVRFLRTLEDQRCILSGLTGYLISWDFCIIETFTAVTVEEDGFIAKDTADEFVHFWFFEFAAVLVAIALESCGSSNLVLEKVTDISIVSRK